MGGPASAGGPASVGGGVTGGGLLLEGPGVGLGAGVGAVLGASTGVAFVGAGWPLHALAPSATSPTARSLWMGPPPRPRRDWMEGIRTNVAWSIGPDKAASRGSGVKAGRRAVVAVVPSKRGETNLRLRSTISTVRVRRAPPRAVRLDAREDGRQAQRGSRVVGIDLHGSRS